MVYHFLSTMHNLDGRLGTSKDAINSSEGDFTIETVLS